MAFSFLVGGINHGNEIKEPPRNISYLKNTQYPKDKNDC